MLRRTITLFLLLAFAAAFARVQGSAQATPPQTLPDLESAGPLGMDLFLQSGSTGMVLVVVRNNRVFFRGYGETAPNSHQLPTSDSPVRICSLSKTFTSDLLMKLVLDHTVRIDTPLQHFAPPQILVPERTRPITLLDLATHTSGLPRETGTAPHGTPHFTFPDYKTRWHWLPNQHLQSTPGTAALYSNVAYDLLGDALQAAAHKPYATLLAERTLNPLNMHQTTLFPNATQCAHLLIGANEEGPCTTTEATAGSSGLYSIPADMAIWLQYLLGTGTPAIPAQNPAAQAVYILPSRLVTERGLDHAGQPTGIGLGWVHLLSPNDPSHIIEKTGGGAGFLTYIAISQLRHTAIFLAATDGPVDTHLNLFNAANKMLLALAGLPPLPPPPPAAKRTRRHLARRHPHPRH